MAMRAVGHAMVPRQRGAAGRLLAATALAGITALLATGTGQPTSFLSGAGGPAPAPGRRLVVLGGAVPALLGMQGVSAAPRVTDRRAYINRQKVELVPVFKQGMDYLEKFGVDDRMLTFLPRMVRKMQYYGTSFGNSDAPDATVRLLEKDALNFQKAVESKDVKAALEAFEVYRLDIPRGTGYFDLKDPSTYEAPPP
mmetsp:Transcript_106765/g.344532  ORF Transcript_106765/g.344532 Transcript_106765/m.344532 type:complete len:197 (-) Transcript_106765:102-692(-)